MSSDLELYNQGDFFAVWNVGKGPLLAAYAEIQYEMSPIKGGVNSGISSIAGFETTSATTE